MNKLEINKLVNRLRQVYDAKADCDWRFNLLPIINDAITNPEVTDEQLKLLIERLTHFSSIFKKISEDKAKLNNAEALRLFEMRLVYPEMAKALDSAYDFRDICNWLVANLTKSQVNQIELENAALELSVLVGSKTYSVIEPPTQKKLIAALKRVYKTKTLPKISVQWYENEKAHILRPDKATALRCFEIITERPGMRNRLVRLYGGRFVQCTDWLTANLLNKNIAEKDILEVAASLAAVVGPDKEKLCGGIMCRPGAKCQ